MLDTAIRMWIFCVLQRTDSSDCWKPRPHDTDGQAVEVKRRPGGEGRDPGEGAVPQRQGRGGWSEVMSVIRRHCALYIYGHDRHYRLSFFLFFTMSMKISSMFFSNIYVISSQTTTKNF